MVPDIARVLVVCDSFRRCIRDSRYDAIAVVGVLVLSLWLSFVSSSHHLIISSSHHSILSLDLGLGLGLVVVQ